MGLYGQTLINIIKKLKTNTTIIYNHVKSAFVRRGKLGYVIIISKNGEI